MNENESAEIGASVMIAALFDPRYRSVVSVRQELCQRHGLQVLGSQADD